MTIEMKLAEYDLETGKFKHFLELGKDFLYGGDSIVLVNRKKFPDGIIVDRWFYGEEHLTKKENKDPLNRFNGLFDGRTYGEGRFVLIYGIKQSAYYNNQIKWCDEVIVGHSSWGISDPLILNIYHLFDDSICGENKGSLHENPELFQNIE